MQSIETVIRLMVIGQEVLIAAILLLGSGKRAVRFSAAALALSVAGYLYASSSILRDSVPALLPLVILLAIIVPYSLWAFARAVFESPWPNPWVSTLCLTFLIVAWGVFVTDDLLGTAWVENTALVMRFVSLTVVLHALWLTARGLPDDLLEQRRKIRVYFILIVAAQIIIVLLAELALGTNAAPAWLSLGNVIIIALLTAGFAVSMLQLNPEFFAAEPDVTSINRARRAATSDPATDIQRKKLLDLMDTGFHQETGLTIRLLAEKLDIPEHQLRRLINGQLGFRNFSAFLNQYRIAAAKIQLGDPERVRIPVLTIALELGYASLGPFNRAFKALTDMTPTEHRRKLLSQASTDTE
jgi:AraC-like DNA-binding protein